ncbi:hypothetical protein DV735_g4701, partial [Chaetothyriales sp. CBS 134920]
MDPGLNSLLQWSLENSAAGKDPEKPVTEPKGLSIDALRALMGGPSDADLMKQAMSVITANDTTHEAKMIAFDNFEQLLENLDNANNLEPLGLWPPLLSELDNDNADLRRMAAWCIGTAVQNNVKSQERCLALGGIPKLCKMALSDPDRPARRKAVYALSSCIRNYQSAMDEAVKSLPKDIVGPDQVSAEDMDVIDAIMGKLRE